jgi:predicted ATPase with chaperone activity
MTSRICDAEAASCRVSLHRGTFLFERITVNPAQAAIKKEGARFDRPMVLGYLPHSERKRRQGRQSGSSGELSLDGNVKQVPRVPSDSVLVRDSGHGDTRQAQLCT